LPFGLNCFCSRLFRAIFHHFVEITAPDVRNHVIPTFWRRDTAFSSRQPLRNRFNFLPKNRKILWIPLSRILFRTRRGASEQRRQPTLPNLLCSGYGLRRCNSHCTHRIGLDKLTKLLIRHLLLFRRFWLRCRSLCKLLRLHFSHLPRLL